MHIQHVIWSPSHPLLDQNSYPRVCCPPYNCFTEILAQGSLNKAELEFLGRELGELSLVKRRYPIPEDESYQLKYKYKNSFQLQKFRQIQIIDSLLHVKNNHSDAGMKIFQKLLNFLEKRARYASLLILHELKNVIPTLKSMENILDSQKLAGEGIKMVHGCPDRTDILVVKF